MNRPPPRPAPVRPSPRPPDKPKLRYRRGRRFPRAITWFGARSFWGHLWHLAASVIATEDIDSRDWMAADDPADLTYRIAAELGAHERAPSLTEALDGDLWVDFVADTGDCASVSQAVARMLFAEYEVRGTADDAGGDILLPRGHLLVFGGDTAYPVATELEINNRVIVPYNQILRRIDDGGRRVLLGIPGNHDWYAGLDGFGRMFRRRRGSVARERRNADDVDKVDRLGQIGHFIEWVEAFRSGRFVGKRSTLPLVGYTPVQSASYWALHLAPDLDLWGPDRQLRAVDFQQQTYFAKRFDERERGIILALADPVHAFLEPSPAGQEILRALSLTLEGDKILVLTGDTHHYCRQEIGGGLHITAGGGGAFLHPARIERTGRKPPEAEFPGPRTSLALALQIPLQIAHGRSGILLHVAIAIIYAPAFGIAIAHGSESPTVAALTALFSFIVCFLIGGWRSGKAVRIGALAALTGLVFGFLPFILQRLGFAFLPRIGLSPAGLSGRITTFLLADYLGTIIFGSFLTALTILGLEHHQAFSALGHPGYKHFVRLRVRRDGSRVDGWVLGRVDPLSAKDNVVLVDQFTWHNPAKSGASPSPSPASSP